MTKILKTSEFRSEAQEAAWWDSHPDETLAVFEQAAKDGTLSRGTLARRSQTAATSIRLDTADIELAKSLTHQRACGIKPTEDDHSPVSVERVGRSAVKP